ncbi:hypothetical protein BACUNI_03117 [Bacteroides uniformis ATCC 8492]|uniref:Uncharacterized protein n=1 Tax=Bacteroides uniformis (strain ATCC 8492 / DSM 6597 / CCUG 4942 / CIP 103695 / JCM 5828 / KCTC 5204 / NCTC 13054 / VPI 0061) TaxID=411479 RepID=A0ABC9N9B8_BACUC|nr:hypothetical protein BACUNI_03117 [Bacteroides uniformis ATCC 8492]
MPKIICFMFQCFLNGKEQVREVCRYGELSACFRVSVFRGG